MDKSVFIYTVIFFITSLLTAQTSKPDIIQASYLSSPITFDGSPFEEAWKQALKISNFTQRELDEGSPASERTEVAVLFDSDFIYFGIYCYDREFEKIIARKMQRDFHWGGDDNFEIILDTFHNKRDGYLFVTNPNAARADALILNSGQHFNKSWDGVWDVKTSISEKGWFAEFKIPFSTLKFKAGNGQTWGVNFERNIRRKNEQVMWQGWSRDSELEQLSRAGTLTGLSGVQDVNLVELKPFGTAGWQTEQGEKSETRFDYGADLNYLITPTLKLNLTANTDFAQVESDRTEINLTRFKLDYPEKREFFLEGEDYFDFGLGRRIRPFYSRRIGLDNEGRQIPILGGARLMGHIGNSTLGGMSLQTSKTDSVESSNYSVLRWKQEIGEESSIGLIGIGKFVPGHQNGVIGADFLYATSKFLNNKTLEIGGAFASSYSPDSTEKHGNAQRLFMSYPSDLIEFDASWERSSKSFNPEIGFMRRENFQMYYAELQFNPRFSQLPYFRNLVFKPIDFNYYLDDETKDLISFEAEFRPLGFQTKSGEFFEFNIIRSIENLDEDFEIQDGDTIPSAEYWFTHYEIQFATFRGRKLAGYTSVDWGDFYNGKRTEISADLIWRLNKNISLTYGSEFNFIELPGTSFNTREYSGRIEYAVSPNLFGLLFGQWNSEDREARFNFRLKWIPKPGANVYFDVNKTYNAFSSQFKLADTTILSKVVWRFTL